MKVLLDENLPHELRHRLPGHDVFTVQYLGWNGLKNGALLPLAGAEGFDVMLTLDNGVAYPQSIPTLPLAVIVLAASSNDMTDLEPLVPALIDALRWVKPKTLMRLK